MNILPKKRWHVRNRDNKERVRKDEENAKEEELKEEQRIALAEQEARIKYLRQKNNIVTENKNSEDKIEAAPSHINLFANEEKNGCSVATNNVDYLQEKKLEKETYEKKIGLLTYVGQSSIELKNKNETPWYLERPSTAMSSKLKETKNESRKEKLDPLTIVHKHLTHKKEKRRSKDKKKKKKLNDTQKSSKKTIEQLREERLKREKHERVKADKYLAGDVEETNVVESNPNRYNSQFNPTLVRKKHNHHDQRYNPY